MNIYCVSCGQDISMSEKQKDCPYCGAPLLHKNEK